MKFNAGLLATLFLLVPLTGCLGQGGGDGDGIMGRTPDDVNGDDYNVLYIGCLLYTSPSPRDVEESRMPSSA